MQRVEVLRSLHAVKVLTLHPVASLLLPGTISAAVNQCLVGWFVTHSPSGLPSVCLHYESVNVVASQYWVASRNR